jgi:hypothetical protein
MLETEYVHALLLRASLEFRDVALFRRNVGAVRLEGRYFRAGIEGQADLYGLGRGGKHYEIECKRFTKLSPAQKRWRDWCAARAIPWLLLEVHMGELPAQTIDRWVSELRRFFT